MLKLIVKWEQHQLTIPVTIWIQRKQGSTFDIMVEGVITLIRFLLMTVEELTQEVRPLQLLSDEVIEVIIA